jgi:hypothetical protein
MARKEKKAKAAGPAVPTTGLVLTGLACLFGAVAASGYLWQKSQIQTLGQQIRQYETRLDEAKRRHLTLDRMYAEMCSPAGLEARVKRSKLQIGPPQLEQIVRLWEPVPQTVEEKLTAQRSLIVAGNQRLLTSSPTEERTN